MSLDQVLGSWTLEKFQIEDPSGNVRDWGRDAHGLLIYAPTGHMSVSINKTIENDPEQTESENRFDSTLFYSGTYQMSGSTITHQVTQASNPERIGRVMIRYAELSGDILRLTTPQEAFGRAILIWKKAQ